MQLLDSIRPILLLLLLGTLGACKSAFPEPAAYERDPWHPQFMPPTMLDTELLHLEPLAPRHTERDHAAFYPSRERLRVEMQWGGWPRDGMSLEANREDLARHWSEFEHREAYAYTVLTPDTKTCVGCIYINPIPSQLELPEGTPKPISVLSFWVTDEVLDAGFERHLLESLLEWFEDEWPYDAVVLDLPDENPRGIALCAELGLAGFGSSWGEGRQAFVWQRD